MDKHNKIGKELDGLITLGKQIYVWLLKIVAPESYEKNKAIWEKDFQSSYEVWYSKAFAVMKIISPDRLADFVSYYVPKNNRKSEIDYENYTLKDYMINLSTSRNGSPLFDINAAAFTKFQAQRLILKSTKELLESVLSDIKWILHADLFDSEIEAAQHLLNNWFFRAAGAICWVIIEKHLFELCVNHQVKISKKNPSIWDYNESLKSSWVIDQKQRRFISLMADYRNECDHKRSQEPTKESIQKLIDGTNEIIKTIF